jgi:hypothetical protein
MSRCLDISYLTHFPICVKGDTKRDQSEPPLRLGEIHIGDFWSLQIAANDGANSIEALNRPSDATQSEILGNPGVTYSLKIKIGKISLAPAKNVIKLKGLSKHPLQ